MPNIRQVEAPQGLGLSPTETGIDARLQEARRVGTFFNQTADLYNQEGAELRGAVADVGQVANDYMTHRDISAGAANGAQLIANLNSAWNETAKNADPNDVTVKQKFLEETLNPTLDKFKDGFSTEQSQAWAEHFVDQYRNHMFEKTSSDMSTLAGIAVRKNVATTINSLSSAVASDPSSLDFALGSVDHSIGAMVDSNKNIDAATAAAVKSEVGLKAKESIVKSAISGMITNNPNVDLDAMQKKYGEYIDGAEMKMFARAAQTQAKANALVDKQTQIAQRQLADQQVHTGATKVMTDNITFDPQTGHPIVDPNFFKQALDLARKNPNAPTAAETVRTMFSWGESQQNKAGKIVDDPQVKQQLTDRLFDSEHPTSRLDLMKAQADGKLSNASFQSMQRIVTELEKTPLRGDLWKSTTAAVRDRLIRKDMPEGNDPIGSANYASFMQAFIPQYLEKVRSGTLPPNALNLNDPTSMISQSLQPYKSTMQDRLRANATAPATEPAQRKADNVVPPSLRGIADLDYSAKRQQYRDRSTGAVYDKAGNEVKGVPPPVPVSR